MILNCYVFKNVQAHLRPVSMLFPDGLPVVEVWLVCCGFTEAKALALKIDIFFKLISQQVIRLLSFNRTLRNCPLSQCSIISLRNYVVIG